jgi:hypothetical protein
MMMEQTVLTAARLKTPWAAAVAGILFALLLMLALVLLGLSIPDSPLQRVPRFGTDAHRVAVALQLVPFAGIAFLWFIGVLRARLGDREDQFFATVFLGSGLLFLAMLFVGAATAGAVVMVYDARAAAEPGIFTLARAVSFDIMNIYAVKVAGVFMISTSTIAIYTGMAARWIAYVGFAAAALLIFGSGFTDWVFMLFPLWVLLMSSYVLFDNLHPARDA